MVRFCPKVQKSETKQYPVLKEFFQGNITFALNR